MRQFMTSTVEQRKEFSGAFTTHPMETGWASEAIFFVTVKDITPHGVLKTAVQISVDGVNWLDEGTTFPAISQQGHYFTRVSHFGGWLRLNGEVTGKDASCKLTIHLVLKE